MPSKTFDIEDRVKRILNASLNPHQETIIRETLADLRPALSQEEVEGATETLMRGNNYGYITNASEIRKAIYNALIRYAVQPDAEGVRKELAEAKQDTRDLHEFEVEHWRMIAFEYSLRVRELESKAGAA